MRRQNSSDVDTRQLIERVIELTRDCPGQPVAFINEGGVLKVGVMSIFPEDEDWYQLPVTLDKLVEETSE